MAASLNLASAGDDIKLWDCTGYTLVKKFNPHSNNVSSLAWSHDNSSLASASVAGDKIVVTYSDAGDHGICLSDGEAQGRTCLAYSSLSRYVVGGGPDAMIYVWDLKTQKMKKAYKGLKGPVTTLQFNYNDTVIASGSESGEIMLYNVVTGLGYMPLRTPKGQAVRQLQYSYMKKTLLGSVSDDGGTYLWDTNTKRLVHSFDGAHKAPASGLAFSPLNYMLLLSIGLDKKIICYDVLSKKPVKVMNAESPLTSVDLHQDGSTLAVGSTRGKVYVYDLRQGANPISVTVAHTTSVHCLRFQKNLVNASECGEPVGRQTQPSSVSATTPTLPSNINSNVKASNKLDSSVSVRGGSLPPATSTSGTATIAKASSEQELIANGKDFELGDVFSPIRDIYSSSTVNTSDNATNLSDLSRVHISDAVASPNVDVYQTSGVGTENGFKVDSLAIVISNSLPDLSERDNRTSGADVYSPVANPLLSGRLGSDFSFVKPSGLSTTYAGASASESSVYLSEKSLLPRSSRDSVRDTSRMVPSLVTPPDAAPSFEAGLGESASATSSEGGSAGGPVSRDPSSYVSAASTQPFQMEFILNAVRDVMDDFHEQIRQDILNMHVEMLKQFHIQQMEMKNLVEAYSVNPDLVAEIQRLREENARLKKNY